MVSTFSDLWWNARDYFSRKRAARNVPVVDMRGFSEFLSTRANHVCQTSLYGYLRTRAGTGYPELFRDDRFIVGVNIAKWHIWLACLSDLAVFGGGLIRHQTDTSPEQVRALVTAATHAVLDSVGVPHDAGEQFTEDRERLRTRLDGVDWDIVAEGEAAFTQSPDALVQWAPVVQNLKDLDGEIVRNSVRFRWQEVRRSLRDTLDAEALIAAYLQGAEGKPTVEPKT